VNTRYAPGQIATNVIGISVGGSHALFGKADGSVWVWGTNTGNALGLGPTSPGAHGGPVDDDGERRRGRCGWLAFAGAQGRRHGMGVGGTNTEGQIGGWRTTTRPTPVPVVGLSGVRAIAAAASFSLALADDGAAGGVVWAWGENWEGQLGDGTNVDRLYLCGSPIPKPIVAIAASDGHAIALANDGTVWTWTQRGLGPGSQ
jgi:alpha-tubulin suppressor-like RCC1 family protein